ncbi:MAG: UDP-N-acetylmuramoyl-L-alanine--D-glutamate ligase [Deltaproteobacteria bacterium]|nr:UDP-N-acetylmuramoyl-L-alanine--D-glutamate ligase [Deltaproteobacteria bacterium]
MREEDLPKRILVVGLGKTGVALVRFLREMGVEVTVTDIKKEDELKPQLEKLGDLNFKSYFGGHRREDFFSTDLIILSPGVDTNFHLVLEAQEKGVKVTGELEFASRFVEDPIIAVTGTNGKTTVTTLIGKLFQEAFGEVFVGGNIGNPLIEYVMQKKKAKFLVLEVSSFQLETIETFRPNCAVLLNITEDHLDRYKNFSEYVDAKLRIFENQSEKDFAVINSEVTLKNNLRAKKFIFSSRKPVNEGAFFDGEKILVNVGGIEEVYPRSISPLFGNHNTENLMASILVARLFGIEKGLIEDCIKKFRGLPHRTEFVRELNGVVFINDSKATNVDATKRALESVNGPVVLIVGGKDKMGSYKPILEEKEKIKAMVVFGEAKERIIEELGDFIESFIEKDLESAVKRAYEIGIPGDTILFSPMCSSFDMFRDYVERGNRFKEIVMAL